MKKFLTIIIGLIVALIFCHVLRFLAIVLFDWEIPFFYFKFVSAGVVCFLLNELGLFKK